MQKLKLAKPSPSFVVSVIALVLALVGTAAAVSALTGQERKQVKRIAKKLDKKAITSIPQGPRGEQGPQGAKGDPGAAAAKLTAFVKQDGTLLYGEGAIQAQRNGTGGYKVTFDTNVGNCVPIATAGNHGNLSGDFDGNFAAVDAIPTVTNSNSTSVEVTFLHADKSQADTSFNLAVLCP